MTEGHLGRHENSMCIRVWLEVGHTCEARPMSSLGRALALDWRVWVRGANGIDISPFVHKIVFFLHPSSAFVYPKRVLQEPPYEIQESGCASIEIPIHIYIKYSEKPKKIKLKYTLNLENYDKNTSDSNCVYYDFQNPAEELKNCLLKGGGEVVANAGVFNARNAKVLVVISDDKEHGYSFKHKHLRENKLFNKFIEPIRWNKEQRRINRNTPNRIGNFSGDVNFKKILRDVAMSDSEIKVVSQFYWSCRNYEKAPNAIILPPISDPIYQMPELPSSLKGCLSSIESDYTLH